MAQLESPFMLAYRSRARMPMSMGINSGGGLLGGIAEAIKARRENEWMNGVMGQIQTQIAGGKSPAQALHFVLSQRPDILAHPEALQMFSNYQNIVQGKDVGKLGPGDKYYGPVDPNTGKASPVAEDPTTAIQEVQYQFPNNPEAQRQALALKEANKMPKIQEIQEGGYNVALMPKFDAQSGSYSYVPIAKSPKWGPSEDQKTAASLFPGDKAKQDQFIIEKNQQRSVYSEVWGTYQDAVNAAKTNPNDPVAQEKVQTFKGILQKLQTQNTNPVSAAIGKLLGGAGADQGDTSQPALTPPPQQPPAQSAPQQPPNIPLQPGPGLIPPTQATPTPQPTPQAGQPDAQPNPQPNADQGGMALSGTDALRAGLLKHRDIYEPAATKARDTGQPVPYMNENGAQSVMTPMSGMMILQMLQQESQGEQQQ